MPPRLVLKRDGAQLGVDRLAHLRLQDGGRVARDVADQEGGEDREDREEDGRELEGGGAEQPNDRRG